MVDFQSNTSLLREFVLKVRYRRLVLRYKRQHSPVFFVFLLEGLLSVFKLHFRKCFLYQTLWETSLKEVLF